MSLFRAKLEVQEGSKKDQSVEFMFNPTQYKISKSNTWNPEGGAGHNVPQWHFTKGEPRTITLDLFFDSYLPRKNAQGQDVSESDVRTLTDKLFSFMTVDSQLEDTNSKMKRPPKVRLLWGQDSGYQFDCYMTDCSVTYTMFNDKGIPVRAEASITLKEEHDAQAQGGTNPTSHSEPGRKVWVVNEGDRLDWIAFKEYGTATEWRRIAEANHLDNPLALQPGMVLSIPPR